jgi:maleate isomerase
VVDYLEAVDSEVVEAVSLEVEDNLAVGRLDPADLLDVAAGLPLRRCDALVLSACVQLASLAAIEPRVGGAGALLAGAGEAASRR